VVGLRKYPLFLQVWHVARIQGNQSAVYCRAVGMDFIVWRNSERGFERIRADEHERTAWSEGSN
jgi:hypothetical protein